MSRSLKKQLYTSLIGPGILYGSETWPLGNKDKNKCCVFERKVLRIIHGPVKEKVTEKWRRRKNTELDLLYNELSILEIIRKERLR